MFDDDDDYLRELDSMAAGSEDSRGLNAAPPIGATTYTMTAVEVAIVRDDGLPMSTGDLTLNPAYPPSIDPTGLIVQMWFIAPAQIIDDTKYLITAKATTTFPGLQPAWTVSMIVRARRS